MPGAVRLRYGDVATESPVGLRFNPAGLRPSFRTEITGLALPDYRTQSGSA